MGVAIDNDGVSTFEEAAARIAALKATLKQIGVPLVFTGEVEQHVHTDPQGRLLARSWGSSLAKKKTIRSGRGLRTV